MPVLRYFEAAGSEINTNFGSLIPPAPEIVIANHNRFVLAGSSKSWPSNGQQQILELVGDLRYSDGPERVTSPYGGTIDAVNVYLSNRMVMSFTFEHPIEVRDFWLDPYLFDTENLEMIGNSHGNYLYGNGVTNAVIRGRGGDDILGSDGPDDVLIGGTGDDSYYLVGAAGIKEAANGGTDAVWLNELQDFEYTLPDNVENVFLRGINTPILHGNASANLIRTEASLTAYAGAGDDRLVGSRDDDRFSGGGGDDVLLGRGGADTLNGGAGEDLLIWNRSSDSRSRAPDIIVRFQSGADVIDLSALDADPEQDGHQPLVWIGSAAFSGARGELGRHGDRLEADMNGDGTADFSLLFEGGDAVTESDILL